MSATLLAVMALASYRLWRVAGRDSWPPSERLREWVKDRQLEADEQHRDRAAWAWAEVAVFVECPWCAGSWCAAIVVAVTAQLASVPLPLLQWGAVACLTGLVGSALDRD